MYSRAISDRDIADVEVALGRPLQWWPIEECRDICATIATHFDPVTHLQITPLDGEQQLFIHDETIRCQLDAVYWLERYAMVRADSAQGGKVFLVDPATGQDIWGSQKIILEHIAYCEDLMWASYDRQVAKGTPPAMIRVNGILIVLLKARQLGASILVILLLLHRFVFWSNLRIIIASADETKTQTDMFELYMLFGLDSLPVWMLPVIDARSKEAGMRSVQQDTTVFLQHAKQETGIGMGGTSHCGLMTELGAWPKEITEQLQNHFFRSIPWSLVTFHVLESLAQGQGNMWHHFSLSALRGGSDAGRWHGIFIPWFAERGKYRLEPPAGWQPTDATLKYAYRVYSTSDKYVGTFVDGRWVGQKVTLDEDQLYFYESERDKAVKDGALEDFLTNYPATPEEAFQTKSGAPFSAAVIERLSAECKEPIKTLEWLDRGARPADLSVNPDDERGLICIYEKPSRAERYVMGVDTAPGLTNWSRRMPQNGDRKKDNCAISVGRIGRRGEPDVLVARFVAPIDYVAAAPIVNYLGRLFRGRDDEMCEAIVETGPTSGEALQERLLNEFGYYNLYRKSNMATYSQSTAFGWQPTQRSVFDLWFRTKPHISYVKVLTIGNDKVTRVKFISLDRYLVDTEMRNCEEDPKRMVGKAEFGFHDDLLRATQLWIYAAHNWQTFGEISDDAMAEVPAAKKPDYQASDMTAEEMVEDVNRKLDPESGTVW